MISLKRKLLKASRSLVRFSTSVLYPLVYIFTGFGAFMMYIRNIETPEAFLPELSMISFTVGMFVLIFGVETKNILERSYFERSLKISLGFLITGSFFMVLMLSTPLITELDVNERDHNLTGLELVDNPANEFSEAVTSLFFAINIVVPIVGLGLSTWFLLTMITDLVFRDLDNLILERDSDSAKVKK